MQYKLCRDCRTDRTYKTGLCRGCYDAEQRLIEKYGRRVTQDLLAKTNKLHHRGFGDKSKQNKKKGRRVEPQYLKLNFGKYNGTMLVGVPDDYLEWGIKEFAPTTFRYKMMDDEIRRRKSLNVWVGKTSQPSVPK